MTKMTLPLIAVAVCLTATGCDFKLKRSGQVTLTAGTASIPLNDRGGSRAELVAGPAEVQVKKGDADRTIDVRVRQPGRPEVNFTAAVAGDYRSGNFTLRGSEIGQPVDMTSARSYTITGPTQRETTIEDVGFERCTVEILYEPCEENWTVSFRSGSGAALGAFASRGFERCNERRGARYNCWRNEPFPHPRFPRGGGRPYFQDGGFSQGVLDSGAEKVRFD